MKIANHIKLLLAGVFFTCILLSPMFVQFMHALEGHEHIACDQIESHIHQDQNDCSLCDYQLSNYQYESFGITELLDSTIKCEKNDNHFSLERTTYLHTFFGRGPPTHT